MIARIYDAASEPAAFGALAHESAREFAGLFSILHVIQDPNARRPDVLLSATPNFDDWAHSSYTGYYRQRDVWALEIAKKVDTGVVHGFEVIDQRKLLSSEIYADWYRKV
jgi:hypothetical protein